MVLLHSDKIEVDLFLLEQYLSVNMVLCIYFSKPVYFVLTEMLYNFFDVEKKLYLNVAENKF